jgi:hypothetical protein
VSGLVSDHDSVVRGWRKSSYSASDGCCLEIAPRDDRVAVRDSKDPDGAILRFSTEAWGQFIAAVKIGDFDR